VAQDTHNRHTAMHPATATTPFTLLWASIEKNEEEPPFRSFAAPPRAQAQQSHRAPITELPTTARPERASTHETAQTAPEAATASSTQNECTANAFAASDFLVTNLRPDLLN